MEQIVEKIQKLLALAESDNQHEAATAAARAAELMTRHQVSEADIPSENEEGSEIVQELDLEKGQKKGWKSVVIKGVCDSVGVQSFYHRGFRCFRLVGRGSDISAAKYMISYLISEIDRLAAKGWADAKFFTAEHGKSWKNSFRVGAATTVSRRLKEMRDSSLREAANAGHSAALVKMDKRQDIIQKYLKSNYNIQGGGPIHLTSRSGLAQGRKAGQNINLSGGKGLTAGVKRLKG